MGGIPWGFKNLPMMDRPTMVVGIDIAHFVGKKKDSVLGFAASMDRYIGKYYLDSIKQPKRSDIRPTEVIFNGLESLF